MKFTKLTMLVLAAMVTFASCSKEEVPGSGTEDLQSGEALISFNIGRSGTTTYATDAEEVEILMYSAKLFHIATGASIPLTGVTLDNGNFKAKVAAAAVVPGPARLYVNINAADLTDGAGATAMDKHDAAIVENNLSTDLAAGAPAGLKVDFELQTGVNPINPTTLPKAKRAIARVGVVNGTKTLAADKQISIKGFKITFDALELTKGGIYKPATIAAGTTKDHSYTVTESGFGAIAGSKNEVAAYMYPSELVNVIVTAPDNSSVPVQFLPEANKNYLLKITPVMTSDSDTEFDFKVEIEDWDTDDSMDADFTGAPKLALDPAFNEDGITVKAGKLMFAADATAATKEINVAKLLGTTLATNELLFLDVVTTTRATAADIIVSAKNDGTDGIYNVQYPLVLNPAGLKVKFIAKKFVDGEEALNLTFPVEIASVLPADFLVDMGTGQSFAPFNHQGSLAADVALFNKINATATTGKFQDKLRTYMLASAQQNIEVAGAVVANKTVAQTSCPKGFKLPTSADYKALVANTLNFNRPNNTFTDSDPMAYRVDKVGTVEGIMNGARAVVSTDYKVALMFTGITGSSSGTLLYRMLDYKGTQMYLNTRSDAPGTHQVWSGLYTTDGNIGLHIEASAIDLFTVANGNTGNMQVRCIKDAAAAGVAW